VNLHTIDISIVIGYLVLCLIIGLFKFGKIKNIRDYTLGNKSFSTAVLIATTFATTVNIRQTIGNIGKTYELGLVFIIPIFFEPICWFIMAKVFAPNLELFHKHKFMSLSDIMGHWYGSLGRWVTNVSSIVLTMGITATSTMAIGYLLHYFMNIPETTGMIIGLGIVTCYSAFGGIFSVAFTDVFQFLIFFIALPLACAIGYHDAGGFKEIIASLPDTHTSINASNVVLFLSLIFYALIPNTGIPFIQRALMTKDEKQFIYTFTRVGVLLIPLLLIICLIGVITYKANPNIEPGIALYYFINHHLSSGMIGLMIAGLLAVIMSTQDSYLNTTSVVVSHDICKQIWPSLNNKQELLIARVSCIFIAAVSMSLIFLQKGMMEIIWLIGNFWNPLVMVPLLAGLLGARISKESFIFLVLSSFSAVTVIRLITGVFDTRSLSVGVITSVIILYFANRRYKKQHPELVTIAPPKEPLLSRLKNNVFSNKLQLGSVYIFCIVMLLSYAAFAFIFPQLWQMKDTLFYLQSTGATLCLLMLLNELWVDKTKRSKYIISAWHFMLCFCLPFLSSYLMFVYGSKVLLIANCVLSVILLRVLSNTVMSIILAFVGIGLGYVLFSIDSVAPILNYNMVAVYSMSSMTIVMAIFLHNKKYIEKQVARTLEGVISDLSQDLKKALAVREEILNNVSHEIRTPVHNYTNIILELDNQWDRTTEDTKRHLVVLLKESNHRFLTICNNLLDFTKFEKRQKKLKIEKCDIEKLLEEIMDEYPNAKNLISIKIPRNLHKIIFCDKNEILRVVSNLLNNAVKYGKNTPITIEVINQGKESIKISVSDKGQGIPVEELKSIFLPFEQSSRTKTGAGGTGAGLSISQKIIEAHGGEIWAENNKDGGATFSFVIPLTKHLP
jgi:signal transduction histidine kinase/Na+/proline symporter